MASNTQIDIFEHSSEMYNLSLANKSHIINDMWSGSFLFVNRTSQFAYIHAVLAITGVTSNSNKGKLLGEIKADNFTKNKITGSLTFGALFTANGVAGSIFGMASYLPIIIEFNASAANEQLIYVTQNSDAPSQYTVPTAYKGNGYDIFLDTIVKIE